MNKKEKFVTILLIASLAYAIVNVYAELSADVSVDIDIVTITGASSESSVGLIIKNPSNGMMLETASTNVRDGQFTFEIPFAYGPGNYELIVGSKAEQQTLEFTIGPQVEQVEEVIDTPYVGNVAPLIEPQIEQQVLETPVKEIPSWVRGVFEMWTSGQISDLELINGIKYLISIGVIVV